MKHHLPLIGIISSLFLFALAAAYYPGGTPGSVDSVGYDWTHHFISTLFAAEARGGAANTARCIAIPAWFLFCLSIGALFRSISRKGTTRPQRMAIEIGGIGSAVYAFLVVTPMHDLLVNIALMVFLAAALAVLHLLHVGRHRGLFWAGVACLASLLTSAVMYYGNVFFGALPVAQKLTLGVYVAWLVALQYLDLVARPDRAALNGSTR